MRLSDAVEGPLFGVAASHSRNAYRHGANSATSVPYSDKLLSSFSFCSKIFPIELVHPEENETYELSLTLKAVSY
jgi:hypothetical protein